MAGTQSHNLEKFEGPSYEKYNAAREKSAADEAETIRKVDKYIGEQVKEGQSYEEVRSKLLKEYVDFLHSSAIQPLGKNEWHRPVTPEQKLALIKRQIYLHKILPEERRNSRNLPENNATN